MKWIKCEKEMPKESRAVLAYREGDLYPVVAFWVSDPIDKYYWMVEKEGLEDENYELMRDLLAQPTHWMPLPELPLTHENSGSHGEG